MSLLQNSNAISTGGDYNLESSLRFRRSANAYLSRTPTTASNRKTFTFSLWFKGKGYYTGNDHLIGVNTSSTSYVRVYYGTAGDNYLRVNQYVGGVNLDLITTQVLRDPSAWYHLVVAFDTTQATASNRIKVYLNGEQITSFSTATYPSQNFDTLFNTTNEHRIGTLGATYNTGYEFDGYMTEVNFVDGQALTPSDFGETDTITGVWKPKEYTGTYGTNGFYLPMKETQQATGFNTVLWQGNGTSQSITGVGFSPDLVWYKRRDAAGNNNLYDTVRGATKYLTSNFTIAEISGVLGVSSFDSDGFTIGNSVDGNASGGSYVGWCWDAGSSTVSNTDGTITSSVRANPATGFSIVTYTGTGTTATVGHGLGVAPSMIIVKNRSAVESWRVGHAFMNGGTNPWNYYMNLNGTGAQVAASSVWNNTAPTSTVFSIANDSAVSGSGNGLVAYCFSEVAGFSKFGSYTGTSASGNTQTLGFRPAFVMIKRTDSANSWVMLDSTRDPENYNDKILWADLSDAEASGGATTSINFLDTGFSFNGNGASINLSGGTYIYMAFADTRDAQFNFDASGNKNNWTANNINSNASSETTYDIMNDVATLTDEDTGNFATLNPLDKGSTLTLSEGNLKFTGSSTVQGVTGTFGMSSGKWYFEYYVNSMGSADNGIGLITSQHLDSQRDGATVVYGGLLYQGNTNVRVNGTVAANYASFTTGDTIGIAFDADALSATLYKNGTLQGTVTGLTDPTNYGGSYVVWLFDYVSASTVSLNFGQRPFKYTPPTGYKKLNTYNLPDSTIKDGSQYFVTSVYTGNGATRSISNTITDASGVETGDPIQFSPDLVWIKKRNAIGYHILQDTIRGAGKNLFSNDTLAEIGNAGDLISSFNTDGFTVNTTYNGGTNGATNGSGDTFVGWSWRGSDSSAVSNTDGTITSTVSANTTSGFSVVTFTGTGATGTVGHGLSQAPELYIRKSRSNAENWFVYTTVIDGSLDFLQLDLTNAKTNSGASLPNASTFEVGAGEANGETLVTYCFHSVEGFSKIGTYTGNGSTDGPFVYTGFRPAFVVAKRTDLTSSWQMWDTSRSTYNATTHRLRADLSDAEDTGAVDIDTLSNGFKLRNVGINSSGGTYIYMAFAENPFKQSLAR